MAKFLCHDCGFEKDVPDSLEGKQAKCPKCGNTVSIARPQVSKPDQQEGSARFSCPQCGFEKKVPAALSGKKAKCPKCSALGLVTVFPPPDLPDDVDDISLDDLAIDDDESVDSGLSKVQQGYSDTGAVPQNLDEKDPEPEKTPLISGNPALNILSGAATGIITVMFGFAFTLLIFSHGTLSNYLGHGLGMLLATSVIAGVVFGVISGIPFGFAAPEATSAVLCYVMAVSVYDQMVAEGIASISTLPTITAALVISTLVTGIFLLVGSKLKIGGLLRFFPYQVAGGLQAGIGALAIKGAWDISIASTLDFSAIVAGQVPPHALLTLSGFAMALAMFAIFNKRVNTYLAVACLLGFVGIYHVALITGAMDMATAQQLCLSYPPIDALDFMDMFNARFFQAINWTVLSENTGYFFAMPGFVAVTLMAKITRLEMDVGRHQDLNQELKSVGTVNLLSGLVTGIPSNFTLKRSLGAMNLGSTCALAGFASAAVCLAALVFSENFTQFLPRCLATALVAYSGIGLIYRWLIRAKEEFGRPQDYAVTVVIFLVTVVFGFLVGAASGLAIAFILLVGQFGKTSVVKHMLSGATHSSNVDRHATQVRLLKQKGGEIFILRLQGFVFIGTTNSLMATLKSRINDHSQPDIRFCILDFAFVSGLDSSVAMSFAKLHRLSRNTA